MKVFSRNEKIICAISTLVLIFTFFYDNSLLRRWGGVRFSEMDGLMLFITDFGLLYLVIALIVFCLVKNKLHDLLKLIVAAALAFELSYILKIIFQTPRPYAAVQVATIPLTQASGYSFPSLHTAFCFAFIPFINTIFEKKWQRILSLIMVLVIALSRTYLGVHYFSDVFAGGLIGFMTAKICLYLDLKYKLLSRLSKQIKDKFELRRQIAHLVSGISIVFLLRLKLINAEGLGLVLIIGGLLSLICKYYKVPYIYKVLTYFERPTDLKFFPGKGSFFLVLGSLISVLLFEENIALAAITIMSVGDSITTIVGNYFGRIKNPFNSKKHLEGTVVAIFFATLGAFYFVDFKSAFMATLFSMTVESFYPSGLSWLVDDNLIIPLVAGITMALI